MVTDDRKPPEFCEASGTDRFESRWERRSPTRETFVCLTCGKRGRRLVADDGLLTDHCKPQRKATS